MSFSADVKEELARIVPRRRCCKKAELLGLLKSCGSLVIAKDGASLVISAESAAVARKTFIYIKHLFGLHAQIVVRRQRQLRHVNVYMVKIPPSDAVGTVMENLGLAEPGAALPERICDTSGPKCCARAFLRGFFLGTGSISSPDKSHHLEMACTDTFSAVQIAELLRRFDIDARVSSKKTGPVVYLKQGQDIADLLNVLGAHSALMKFENVRAYKTVKSRVNRLVNMETANLTKLARAAARQVEDIKLIDQKMGLASLPEHLYEIARLRLEYPEASLEELGKMATPQVTKSGVNHRMRRLSEIAREIREHQERERNSPVGPGQSLSGIT